MYLNILTFDFIITGVQLVKTRIDFVARVSIKLDE